MLKLKDNSVNVARLSPEMYFAAGIVEAVFARYGLDATITSAADATHNPGSLHSQGKAIDLRWDVADPRIGDAILSEIVRRLDRRGFDVVDERTRKSAAWTAPHVHIEYQPKAGEQFWH